MSPEEAGTNSDLTFVYVHGFGEGGKTEIPFVQKMGDVIKECNINANVQPYIYSKEKLDFLNIIDQWQESKKVVENSGKAFYTDVVMELERKQKPYYIIAYSLGTKVIAKCLEESETKLQYLKGIYFIGSALPHEVNISSKILPDTMKIINYYSSNLDYILKVSFRIAEGKNAGGEIGFDDKNIFINRRTVCTHAHKGGPITRDYSDMAEAITYLALFNEKIFIKGEACNFNLKMQVSTGSLHWNDLTEFKNESGQILIQQNVNTGHYRAVSIEPNGKRHRVAWGTNMHSILNWAELF